MVSLLMLVLADANDKVYENKHLTTAYEST